MRVFTVITAVFLPLTLIVGWYGMNLRMPELASPVTYPIIIGVSLVFLFVSLVYSKYKGWL
jgi:magnesium transporter